MKTPSIHAGSLLNILRIDSSSNFATGYILSVQHLIVWPDVLANVSSYRYDSERWE